MLTITAERLKKGISSALGQPTAVTRRGKTVAVMVDLKTWERLQALEGAALPADPVVLGDTKRGSGGRPPGSAPAFRPLPRQVAQTEHTWHPLPCARCHEPIGTVASFDLERSGKTPIYCRGCSEWTKAACIHCGRFIGTSPTPHAAPVMFCLPCAARDSRQEPLSLHSEGNGIVDPGASREAVPGVGGADLDELDE